MKVRSRLGFGILALLALFVAAVGASIAWWICAAACTAPTEAGGTPGAIVPLLIGAVSGLGAWVASGFLGRPITEIENARVQAMRTAERYAYIPAPKSYAEEDRVIAARAVLGDIATVLRAHARAQPWPVQLYCQWRGYDLDLAFLAMNGLHSMAGSPGYDNSTRKNNVNLLYLSLNAHAHLTADQIAELRRLVAQQRNDVEPLDK